MTKTLYETPPTGVTRQELTTYCIVDNMVVRTTVTRNFYATDYRDNTDIVTLGSVFHVEKKL